MAAKPSACPFGMKMAGVVPTAPEISGSTTPTAVAAAHAQRSTADHEVSVRGFLSRDLTLRCPIGQLPSG